MRSDVGRVNAYVTVSGEASQVLREIRRFRSTNIIERVSLSVVVPEGRHKFPEEKFLPEIRTGDTEKPLQALQYIERRLDPDQLRKIEPLISDFGDICSSVSSEVA